MMFVLSVEASWLVDRKNWTTHKVMKVGNGFDELVEFAKTCEGFDDPESMWIITDLETEIITRIGAGAGEIGA